MRWERSWKADPRGKALADRHYNRHNPASPQFVKPAEHVLALYIGPDHPPAPDEASALWVSTWPRAEHVRHAWAGAWECATFRNEGAGLSSELILEAVAATRAAWGTPPELGMVTFVDRRHTRSKRHAGYCYRMAGFEEAGRTTDVGLVALVLPPERFPAPAPALPTRAARTALHRLAGGQTSMGLELYA